MSAAPTEAAERAIDAVRGTRDWLPDDFARLAALESLLLDRFAVIVGPDEERAQVFNLRDLATRQEQKAVPWSDLESAVKSALAKGEGAGP